MDDPVPLVTLDGMNVFRDWNGLFRITILQAQMDKTHERLNSFPLVFTSHLNKWYN